VQQDLLERNSDPALRVYAVWFNMYPGDARGKWPAELLTDHRVVHYWDERRLLGVQLLLNLPTFLDRQAPGTRPPEADALWDKRPKPVKPQLFRPRDFQVAPDLSHCICPAGKRLYRNGRHHNLNGFEAIKFTGTKRECGRCALRERCLRHPESTPVRQVAIFLRKVLVEHAVERMKELVDSERGHELITQRFATVEPVFANIRFNKGLDRFTLRGEGKVDGQWKLSCLVHNIEKLANNGYARR